MRVGCVICSDSFVSFVDVSSIPCGHTFHTHCLLQWIEKSKSCPSCRHKTTYKNVQKLFFDAIGSEQTQVDPDTLQNQIDSLRFQLVEKSQILRNVREENQKLTGQKERLRDDYVKLENTLKEKDSTITAYKEHFKHMEEVIRRSSKAEEEARVVREKLKLYEKIKVLVENNAEDIENTITSNISSSNLQENIKNLSTISCVLQSRINKLIEEKRKYADENHSILSSLKETKKNLSKNEEKLKYLEKENKLQKEDIQSLEKENESLRQKVDKLQEAIVSPSADVKNSLIRRFISESPAPVDLKRNVEVELTPEITRKVPRISLTQGNCTQSKDTTTQSVSEDSPYLRVKSASIMSFSKPVKPSGPIYRELSKGFSSIFKDDRAISGKSTGIPKKNSYSAIPCFPSDDFGYDGLGGHHKVDHFPDPNRPKLPPNAKKPGKNISKTNMQISSKTLKDFFKDPFADD